jgi:hypothetical protein
VITGKRPEAFPAAMRVLLRLGTGPRVGMTGNRPADGGEPELALAAGDAKPVGLTLAAGLEEPVELALGLGLAAADPVGLALGLGVAAADPVGLALGDKAGEARPAAVALGAGVGADVDGGAKVHADAEDDADAPGEPEAPRLVGAPPGAGGSDCSQLTDPAEVSTVSTSGPCPSAGHGCPTSGALKVSRFVNVVTPGCRTAPATKPPSRPSG